MLQCIVRMIFRSSDTRACVLKYIPPSDPQMCSSFLRIAKISSFLTPFHSTAFLSLRTTIWSSDITKRDPEMNGVFLRITGEIASLTFPPSGRQHALRFRPQHELLVPHFSILNLYYLFQVHCMLLSFVREYFCITNIASYIVGIKKFYS